MKEDQESLKLIERLIAEENQLKEQKNYDEMMALKLHRELNSRSNQDFQFRNRNNHIDYSEDCIIIDDD